jgi:hypothetical protein
MLCEFAVAAQIIQAYIENAKFGTSGLMDRVEQYLPGYKFLQRIDSIQSNQLTPVN